MGIFYVLLSTVLNGAKGFCSKKLSGKTKGLADSIDVSLLKSVLSVLFGAVFLALNGLIPIISPKYLWICALSGGAAAINYVFWVLSLKGDAFVFVSAANASGFVVTVLGAVLFLKETLSLTKLGAIVVILFALFFMTRYQTETHGKLSLFDLGILLGVFLTQGVSQFAQKLFTSLLPNVSVHVFTFYSFVLSVVILAIIRAFVRSPKAEKRVALGKQAFIMVAFSAAAFYGSIYFQALASTIMDAVVLYPLSNGLSLVSGVVISWVFFKEKPNKNSIIGILLIFVALLLIRL